MKRILVALTLSAIAAGSWGANAATFAAHHESPRVVIEAQDLKLHTLVATDCTAYCGWVEATLHYRSPGDAWQIIERTVPAISSLAIEFSVPAEDVTTDNADSPTLEYWFEVVQQTICDQCTTAEARLPHHGVFEIQVLPAP